MTTFREGSEWMREEVIAAILHEAEGWNKENQTLVENAVRALCPTICALPIPQPETQGELAAAKRGVVVPTVATEDMISSGEMRYLEMSYPDKHDFASSPWGRNLIAQVYYAMLAAAPQQNAAPQVSEVKTGSCESASGMITRHEPAGAAPLTREETVSHDDKQEPCTWPIGDCQCAQLYASAPMPRDDEIRLAMGELTADQMRTAKAAIRWVLSRQRT